MFECIVGASGKIAYDLHQRRRNNDSSLTIPNRRQRSIAEATYPTCPGGCGKHEVDGFQTYGYTLASPGVGLPLSCGDRSSARVFVGRKHESPTSRSKIAALQIISAVTRARRIIMRGSVMFAPTGADLPAGEFDQP
jgi:hypothetical protein